MTFGGNQLIPRPHQEQLCVSGDVSDGPVVDLSVAELKGQEVLLFLAAGTVDEGNPVVFGLVFIIITRCMMLIDGIPKIQEGHLVLKWSAIVVAKVFSKYVTGHCQVCNAHWVGQCF